MEQVFAVIKYVGQHWQEILGALGALFMALIAIFAMIPGPQPEKFLQSIVNIISKFSVKPKV